MKTQHSILARLVLAALLGFASTTPAQPAISKQSSDTLKQTSKLWRQLVRVVDASRYGSRVRPDSADLESYEVQFARLSLAAERYSALDLSGADPLLVTHIKECVAAHKGMAQAVRRAGHEFVPALQALIPDLQKSQRAVSVAADRGFDLSSAGINEATLAFVASLVGDKILADESRYISVQCRLVSKADAEFAQAEQRLRDSQSAHNKVALALVIQYGPEVLTDVGHPVALWTW